MSKLPESRRLRFYIAQGGQEYAENRALEAARIYRRSVLNNGHNGRPFCFASTPGFRRGYIESYLHFKRFALTGRIGDEQT